MCVSTGPLLAMSSATIRSARKAATNLFLARVLYAIVDAARICIDNNCQHNAKKEKRHFGWIALALKSGSRQNKANMRTYQYKYSLQVFS